MIAIGQLWQVKQGEQLIKIIDINNKIVVAQPIPSGPLLFFSLFNLPESYSLVSTTTEKAQATTNQS